ncbi:MAG TPA: SAM-dependent methyltransferase [Dehalococcoidia bacterium]|nr:SAM-dependent methyltransferase [Dehalococcoidia bacterium]
MSLRPEDEFAPITESGPLVDELRARIAADGPITFRDFMAAALYHPRHGYYSTHADAMTRGGDYVTSPEIHPIFGVLVAKHIIEVWKEMGAPPRFQIVELGGGGGLLARDIIRRAAREPAFARALRYTIVETSALLVERQRRTVAEAADTGVDVAWSTELPRAIEGCVLSNEFFDALPVHRVRCARDELLEVYVTHNGDRFADTFAPPSTPALGAYFDALGLLPGEGCYAEVNLEALGWTERIAASLERGVVLTFDYGYEARALYAPWRRDGTLLCFYRQSISSDPYARVGKQDITSSVDFTTLRAAGERAGLRADGFTDQSAFLVRSGIGAGLAAPGEGGQLEEYFARRNVVMDLIDPGKLGRIKVLLQSKGLSSLELQGFADA